MQFRQQWFSLSSHVEVYNTTQQGARVGLWSDFNVFCATRYAFIGSRSSEDVMIEARPPWGLYFGLRYDMWRCGGLPEETFHIEQDVWATPFYKFWDPTKIFNIAQGTRHIAKSYSHTNNRLFTSLFSDKEIIVTGTQGETLATINQESQLQAGFSNRRYFTKNLRPDIIPNEVVSFLAGVWELNGVKEKSQRDSEPTTTSESRRRRR